MSKQENKGLVPKLRFPEFQGSGQWEKTTVKKLVSDEILYPPKDGNHGNIHPKSSDYVDYGIPFIMANDIRNGYIDFSKCSHISKEQADSLQKGFAKEGDVLLTHKGTVGEVAIAEKSEYPYLMLTPQVTYYRIKNEECLLKEYLAAWFISEIFQRKLLEMSGGGTRAYIGITEQSKLKIILPKKINEQQKIGDFLSSLDKLVIAQNQKLEYLRTYKKGLMQQLFPAEGETVPELRFPEFQGDEPWKIKSFSKLFEIGGGKDHKHMPEGEIPIYGSGGYMRSGNEYLYDGESACIGRKGTINKPMFLTGKFWTVDTLFYTHSFNECIPKFVFLLFQNIDWLSLNEAGGVPSLSKVIINKIEVMVPEADEQQKIIDCIFSIDDLITKQKEKIESMKTHKKGLMQQLFPSVEAV